MANFGDINTDLVLAASQAVRRNAANDAFEAFVPASATEVFWLRDIVGAPFLYPKTAGDDVKIDAELFVDTIKEYSSGVTIEGIKSIDSYWIIPEITAPAGTPAATEGYLFMDSADDHIKFKNSTTTYDLTDTGGGGMVYPGAGIALSTGAAWGTSIADNSTNWNTAYSHSQIITGNPHALDYNDVGAAAVSHVHGNITNAGAIGSTTNLPIITTTSGVLIASSFGTGANTFCQGNDARLSDSRTPTAHAMDSATYHTSSDVTTLNATTSKHGFLPKLGGGTTNYLRADGTWATPPGGSAVSVANQGDNRVVTATAVGDALNAEANFTFDGTTLSVIGGSYQLNITDETVDFTRASANYIRASTAGGYFGIITNGLGVAVSNALIYLSTDAAYLRHGGATPATKFATTATGVNVTGAMVSNTAEIGGDVTINAGGATSFWFIDADHNLKVQVENVTAEFARGMAVMNTTTTYMQIGFYGVNSTFGSGFAYIGKAYNDQCAKFYPDAQAELHYNNAIKFETTTLGVLVTGEVKSSSGYFASNGANVYLGVTGGGTVYLRPTAYGSATAQSTFSITQALVGTPLAVTGALQVNADNSAGYAAIFDQDHATAHGIRINLDATAGITYNAIYAENSVGQIAELRSDGDWWAADYILSSDKRLKDIYATVEDGLDGVMKLNPVTFRWKDKRNDLIHTGFVAQEVREVYPELVKKGSDGFLSLSYGKMSVLAIAGVQDLSRKVDTIEDRLQKRITELEDRVQELEDDKWCI